MSLFRRGRGVKRAGSEKTEDGILEPESGKDDRKDKQKR